MGVTSGQIEKLDKKLVSIREDLNDVAVELGHLKEQGARPTSVMFCPFCGSNTLIPSEYNLTAFCNGCHRWFSVLWQDHTRNPVLTAPLADC